MSVPATWDQWIHERWQEHRRGVLLILRTDWWMATHGERGHYDACALGVVALMLRPWLYCWGWAHLFDLLDLDDPERWYRKMGRGVPLNLL
jgi:hypothetical protein